METCERKHLLDGTLSVVHAFRERTIRLFVDLYPRFRALRLLYVTVITILKVDTTLVRLVMCLMAHWQNGKQYVIPQHSR